MVFDIRVLEGAKDAEGDFFRLLKSKAEFGYAQGNIHGFTASGKHLCSHSSRNCDVRAALAAWNKLPPEERKPGAVKVDESVAIAPKGPTPPAGTLVVQIWQTRLERDAQEKLRQPEKMQSFGWGRCEPGHDFLWLRRAEWKSLLPANPLKGKQLAVPVAVAEKIVFPACRDISNGTGNTAVRWNSKHVRRLDLTLTVEEASPDSVRLRLQGPVLLVEGTNVMVEHKDPNDENGARYDGQVLGYLTYDLKKKAFSRFDLVVFGEHKGWFDKQSGPKKLLPPYILGVALSLPTGAIAPPVCETNSLGLSRDNILRDKLAP